jgi:hypothetical protein
LRASRQGETLLPFEGHLQLDWALPNLMANLPDDTHSDAGNPYVSAFLQSFNIVKAGSP